MLGHDIIVVGASAGGVEVLCQLVRDLPPDLPAAIFIVLHISPQGTSVLPQILNRSRQKRYKDFSFPAAHAQDGEEIVQGRIYVAPPDHHLLIKEGYVRVTRGPKENSHRPAVDPLFRTAARIYGRRVVGVVLSGTLDDGTAGLVAIKQQGGMAVVQDPEDAMYSGMPTSAIENVAVDHILPVADIAPVLMAIANQPIQEGENSVSEDMEMESDMAELELEAMQSSDRPGTPSPFACPECAGVLWELSEGGVLRFRCRTGHAYSVGTLLAEQAEGVEDALWSALRALEEKAALAKRMAERARDRGSPFSAKHFEQQSQDLKQRAAVLRQLIIKEGDGQIPDAVVIPAVANGQVAHKGVTEQKKADNINTATLQTVAIAVSSEGLNALSQVLSKLPAQFGAAIIVVQHSSQHPSPLVNILTEYTTLEVKEAELGDLLQPGKIYTAPPNYHLLVNHDRSFGLLQSQLVSFVRPSADLLFESVAATFKERAIAVVLDGKGKDGALGVQAIKKMGGKAIAQEKTTSEDVDMPQAAIETGCVDWVVPLDKIAATLIDLVKIGAQIIR